jgi:outer membrane beta-barrel protein
MIGRLIISFLPLVASQAPKQAQEDQQTLVSGAPLDNPNVAVHVVEKKPFADRGRHEIVLYPAAIQLNGKFTQHFGSAASYVYHLHENFALQLLGQYNWYSAQSGFSQELTDKVRVEAQAATSLLLVWALQGGVEVTPIYGKFAFFEGSLAHFSLVISAGAGIGSTRHQLHSENVEGPATFGDTGLRFVGSVGAGFRVQFGARFALRLEVRDLAYTARVDSVNGCNTADLTAMYSQIQQGQPVTAARVSGGCSVSSFSGMKNGYNLSDDVPIALNLVSTPSSDVLNNLGFYAGVSILF